jgi:hypothetical protein
MITTYHDFKLNKLMWIETHFAKPSTYCPVCRNFIYDDYFTKHLIIFEKSVFSRW